VIDAAKVRNLIASTTIIFELLKIALVRAYGVWRIPFYLAYVCDELLPHV
jgi:hypothetical protein